jgi:hypothetical protein
MLKTTTTEMWIEKTLRPAKIHNTQSKGPLGEATYAPFLTQGTLRKQMKLTYFP